MKGLMKFKLGLLGLLLSLPVYAIETGDLDFQQSSSGRQWYTIENQFVRLIYPSEFKAESLYVANLIEYYSQYVGKTYGITQPRQFDLVIRSEVSEPNGYVTLMPRRSEWFASSIYFPYVGATEWYQTLAIHEYRHVNQFDHFNQRMVKVLYSIMGEGGWLLAAALSLPSWYLEGDAVWAETKYTDGGRGRSPRFLARLKALVLSDQIPSFDQFVGRSYRTDIPNHYIYGYALISYGVSKYGEDIWQRVSKSTAGFPYPLRFYRVFEKLTGQRFEDFYNETMQDLKKKWSADQRSLPPAEDFRERSLPTSLGGAVYSIRQTLDTYAEVIRRDAQGQESVIASLPYNREVVGVDIRGTYLVYNQYLPHWRYGHKSSSDLVLINLKNGRSHQITHGRRFYNPSLSSSGDRIWAVEFEEDQSWKVVELDLEGQRLRAFDIPHGKPAFVRAVDDSKGVLLLNSPSGYKSLEVFDFNTQKITKTLLPPSRNLLNALWVDPRGQILFEAQYKGRQDIFKIKGIESPEVSRCTESAIAAYTPTSDGETLFYADQDAYGSVVATQKFSSCTPIEGSELVGFKYLGDSPSDAYNKFVPHTIADQDQFFSRNAAKYQEKTYGDFDSHMWVPHTWGLLLARGSGVGVQGDNYLRTLGYLAQLGTNAEEKGSFANLQFDIKKFAPLLRLQVEGRNRDVEQYLTSNTRQWNEISVGLATVLPYVKRVRLNNFMANLKLEGSYVDAFDYKLNEAPSGEADSFFYKTAASVNLIWGRDFKPRSIQAPWLLSYRLFHENAEQPSDEAQSSYRVLQSVRLQMPGFSNADGWTFSFDEQNQKDSPTAYRFVPQTESIGYVFSRGYKYEDVPYFHKTSSNYVFPISYPDWNLSRYYYLRRIYANLFYDSTYVKLANVQDTLNSYGFEVFFESMFFRFLPLTFGGRILQKEGEQDVEAEAFLATQIGF